MMLCASCAVPEQSKSIFVNLDIIRRCEAQRNHASEPALIGDTRSLAREMGVAIIANYGRSVRAEDAYYP